MLWPHYGTHHVFGQLELTPHYGVLHTHTHTYTLILAKLPAENLQLKDLLFCLVTHQERKGITIYFTLVIFPTVLQYLSYLRFPFKLYSCIIELL